MLILHHLSEVNKQPSVNLVSPKYIPTSTYIYAYTDE